MVYDHNSKGHFFVISTLNVMMCTDDIYWAPTRF
jgi:hypothetical protein